MSQQPRFRPSATPDETPAPVAAMAPAPSNAPTIFLLILVVGMMGFIAWWAFLGKGARAKTNATLPPPPRLDAVPTRLKPSPKPIPSATPSVARTERDVPALDEAAPNEGAPSISEVPAPVASPALKQKAAKGGAVSSGPD